MLKSRQNKSAKPKKTSNSSDLEDSDFDLFAEIEYPTISSTSSKPMSSGKNSTSAIKPRSKPKQINILSKSKNKEKKIPSKKSKSSNKIVSYGTRKSK